MCVPHHATPRRPPLQIHWFSIFNSFMMVIFLTGLVSMILMRTLRRDYARYTRPADDDLESIERDISEESGWKLVRPAWDPEHPSRRRGAPRGAAAVTLPAHLPWQHG